ncbi:MAG: hypothetical protein U1E65_29490 [Myxococcota bacterium]
MSMLPPLRSLLDASPVVLIDARARPTPSQTPATPPPAAPLAPSAVQALVGAPPAGALRPQSADPNLLAHQLHASVARPGVVSADPAANERWIDDHASFRYADASTHEPAVRGALDFIEQATPRDLAALSPDARDTLSTALTQGMIDSDRTEWAAGLRQRIDGAIQKLDGADPLSSPKPPYRSMADLELDSIQGNLEVLAGEIHKAGGPNTDASALRRAQQLLDQARTQVTPGQDQPMPAAGQEASEIMRALIRRYPEPWSRPIIR